MSDGRDEIYPENGIPRLGHFLLAVIGIAGALSLIGFWSTGFAVFVVVMWVIFSLMVLVAGWSDMLNESISQSDWKCKVRHANKDYRAVLAKNEILRELDVVILVVVLVGVVYSDYSSGPAPRGVVPRHCRFRDHSLTAAMRGTAVRRATASANVQEAVLHRH